MGAVARRGVPGTRSVDIDVALEVTGYRWVIWREGFLQGAPLQTAGRFLAHPEDLLAHLHAPATTKTPVGPDGDARVPRYSEDVEDAFRAAAAADLFGEGRACLGRSAAGVWTIRLAGLGETVESESLAEALCLASLLWVRRDREG